MFYKIFVKNIDNLYFLSSAKAERENIYIFNADQC